MTTPHPRAAEPLFRVFEGIAWALLFALPLWALLFIGVLLFL